MAFTVKHKFQSQLPDSADESLIRPSNWNDTHDITMDGPGLMGRAGSGAGTAAHITLGAGLAFSGSTITAGSIAGRSLTISASNPSGGADGDVWFQI